MQTRRANQGRLCQGLAWRQWAAVLAHGRRKRLAGQCWLETFSNSDEIFAMVLKGHVSVPSPALDRGDKQPAHFIAAPAIIKLSSQPETGPCHWLAGQADVYFYRQAALRAAFVCAPGFAFNFVEALCTQHTMVIETLGDPAPVGVARLAGSLLARSGSDDGECSKVWITQAELACETGLSRQWVNRLLRGLEKRGIAQLGRGYVVLSAPARLMSLCKT